MANLRPRLRSMTEGLAQAVAHELGNTTAAPSEDYPYSHLTDEEVDELLQRAERAALSDPDYRRDMLGHLLSGYRDEVAAALRAYDAESGRPRAQD